MDKIMNLDLKSSIAILTEKIIDWYELLIKNIPNLIVAVLVIILFVILSKLTRYLVSKALPKITTNRSIGSLIRTVSSSAVLFIGLFISLEILNLEKTVTSILAGAGVLGLALGFAFQEIASNFVSGIFIALKRPYQIGDIVKIDDFFGEVTKISLRTTSITTFQGLETLIPNKDMFTKPFTNLTTTPRRRVDISVGVSYADDLKKVEEVLNKTLEDISVRIPKSDIDVFFEEFGGSSINLSARFWVKYPNNKAYLKGKHEAIIKIKDAFDKNNISIPFPIRTLDFGIEGGKELEASLKEGLSSGKESAQS